MKATLISSNIWKYEYECGHHVTSDIMELVCPVCERLQIEAQQDKIERLEGYNEELQSQIGLSELVINRFKAENDQLRDELAAAFAAGLKIEQRAGKSEAERDRLREVGNYLAEEALENWKEGRVSVDMRDAALEWKRCAALEDKE